MIYLTKLAREARTRITIQNLKVTQVEFGYELTYGVSSSVEVLWPKMFIRRRPEDFVTKPPIRSSTREVAVAREARRAKSKKGTKPKDAEPKPKDTQRPTSRNIQAITQLEREALHDRTRSEKVSDQVAKFSGSMLFVWFHVAWFGFWMLINLNLIPGIEPFDPFPFSLLTMMVSLEAIFLSTFVLISQNRANQQADKRAHLDLQVNLLSEQEMTKVLEMLKMLCEHNGLKITAQDRDVKDLIAATDLHELARELESRLPEQH
jgi:uncharacterized membrane protein